MASCAAVGNRRSSSGCTAGPRRPIADQPQLNKLPHKATRGDKIRRYVLVASPKGALNTKTEGILLLVARVTQPLRFLQHLAALLGLARLHQDLTKHIVSLIVGGIHFDRSPQHAFG